MAAQKEVIVNRAEREKPLAPASKTRKMPTVGT